MGLVILDNLKVLAHLKLVRNPQEKARIFKSLCGGMTQKYSGYDMGVDQWEAIGGEFIYLRGIIIGESEAYPTVDPQRESGKTKIYIKASPLTVGDNFFYEGIHYVVAFNDIRQCQDGSGEHKIWFGALKQKGLRLDAKAPCDFTRELLFLVLFRLKHEEKAQLDLFDQNEGWVSALGLNRSRVDQQALLMVRGATARELQWILEESARVVRRCKCEFCRELYSAIDAARPEGFKT